jgi:hypothetical protein
VPSNGPTSRTWHHVASNGPGAIALGAITLGPDVAVCVAFWPYVRATPAAAAAAVNFMKCLRLNFCFILKFLAIK